MKTHSAAENLPIMSNVGEIGEFRIRNSSKAFSILSSGLYSNKIKAIIRELSCNAVDSHVDAGRGDVPFEIHLPNALETWFSIRDFGTGLDHDQVSNIYTTYFESTKTDSDAFIGALGLGSKSPFSYTDNFTVTAIKNGRKGVYTAFINQQGVPSIALMHQEETTEPPGVEVKISVLERDDFRKFYAEAEEVFQFFKLRPIIKGGKITIPERKYHLTDIIPGVHTVYSSNRSYAIMGNIGYPIEVPNASQNLGELEKLLSCKLEINFDIGELDIQASREGLSYIPSTIDSIKKKLDLISKAIAIRVKKEIDDVPNQWEKVWKIRKLLGSNLTELETRKYIKTHSDLLVELVKGGWNNHWYLNEKEFRITSTQLEKWNISINAWSVYRYTAASMVKPLTRAMPGQSDPLKTIKVWEFKVTDSARFVINDVRTNAVRRAKYHFKNAQDSQCEVYILSPVDSTKPTDTASFFAAIHGPPANQIFQLSTLSELPKTVPVKRDTKVMVLDTPSRYKIRSSTDITLVWREYEHLLNEFDKKETYYYIPLSGTTSNMACGLSAHRLGQLAKNSGIPSLADNRIFGIRKSDQAAVQKLKNWKPYEEYVAEQLVNVPDEIIGHMAITSIDSKENFLYNARIISQINSDSPFVKYTTQIHNAKKILFSRSAVQELCKAFRSSIPSGTSVEDKIQALIDQHSQIYQRYALIPYITVSLYNDASVRALVEYINLIDHTKGI